MWVFYLISLPLTLGMVLFTLRYFAGPESPRYVLFTVGYAWFCSLSIIILVPADIWTTLLHHENAGIAFFGAGLIGVHFYLPGKAYTDPLKPMTDTFNYLRNHFLRAVVPLIQGYEDAGDFTVTERLKTSIHVNLVFYLILGAIGLLGLILLISMHKKWHGSILGMAMGCSNTFGLVTGAFLLGFGLSEIPKSIWKNADWTTRQKVFSHKISKMAVKLDDAHQELSNAIVVAQATSNQMSKRDPLRRYMDVIDNMLAQMFREDPSFKPQGGRLGENDMDYDTDVKSMATLRRHLRGAREEYYRYKSEYTTCVMGAIELEDTIKNYEHRNSTGWKYVSTLRPARTGTLGSILDTVELVWRCIMKKQIEKMWAIILGVMSVAILLAEATLLPRGVDLSLFSILINSVKKQEVLVQVFAFVPLMYMCACTYYSLFKIGMLMFYSLTPRQTSPVNLLMICSMVARYAPPISYNFLNLISLDGGETYFEKRMGNIDKAVPFFGNEFNRIYPLIMVIYTIMVGSNVFDRIIKFFGNWKRLRFQTEADDMDGFDPSGLIILQKERSWLEEGRKLGEHVIPLARNFNNTSIDVESARHTTEKTDIELKSSSKPLKDENKYGSSREAISNKYAAMQEQSRQAGNTKPEENKIVSAKISLLDPTNPRSDKPTGGPSSAGLVSTWASMKNGFQTFKANVATKKFLPLRQSEEKLGSRVSSTESLDQIFQKLNRPALEHERHRDREIYSDDDDDETGISSSTR